MNEELVKRLNIMSGMLTMGERIAFGSDAALLSEAAKALQDLDIECQQSMKTIADERNRAAAAEKRCQELEVAYETLEQRATNQLGELEFERDRAEAAEQERDTLRRAAENLYFAAYWHPDRECDETALWTELRDAAGIEPGQSKSILGEPK